MQMCGPLPHAKFHIYKCNVLPLGAKTHFWITE